MNKRKIRHTDKGFSLVELIIVIAIMAILVGILAPQFIKYVGKSRSSVCTTNIDTIAHEYAVESATLRHVSVDEAADMMQKIMEGHSAEKLSGETMYNGGRYKGICKEGGVLGCMLSTDFSTVDVTCSVHGSLDIETLADTLTTMTFPNSTYTSLNQYFNGSRTSLDSTAVGTDDGTHYGGFSSFAELINDSFIKNGINVSNRSWRMYNNNRDQYNLFLTDQLITMEDVGKTITCTKYDLKSNTVTVGTIKVISKVASQGGNYPVLDGGSFKAAS